MTTKTPLLGKSLNELKTIVQDLGMPKFTAGQIASWLYDKKVGSIEEMTNLSLKNRERLMENYEVGASAPVHEMRSVDGTVKYLFCTPEGDYIESVYIPDDDRATLCVSSQVGCKMNCKFCMTGKQGKICPCCGSGETWLIQGNEFTIKEIAVPDEPQSDAAE
jgi:23S rRNA (adenine2503-C2)-methyltransferase